jgi:hypothetical protein
LNESDSGAGRWDGPGMTEGASSRVDGDLPPRH